MFGPKVYRKIQSLGLLDRGTWSEANTDDDEEEGFFAPSRRLKVSMKTWLVDHWSSISFHLLLIGANLLLFVIITTSWLAGGCIRGLQLPPTTLGGVIAFEQKTFDFRGIFKSDGTLNRHKKGVEYVGPPRPEFEKAWADLQESENYRVLEDELGEFAGQESLIKLGDGSGYYGTVALLHGLHCVQRLHHFVYADHYYPNLEEKDKFNLRQHTEHCLDYLRQYVQCNADVTIIPMRWATDSALPTAMDWGKHQCVAWKPLAKFIATRSFNPFEPDLLVHPYLGSPYAPNNTVGPPTGASPLGKGGFLGGDHGPV